MSVPGGMALTGLSSRDQALGRAIALTTMRRLGELEAVLKKIYRRGLPARTGRLRGIVLNAACQILFMNVPDHAAVDLAVKLAGYDKKARHHKGLVNAGLRNIAREGKSILDGLNSEIANTPKWLLALWDDQWGSDTSVKIAEAHQTEAPLDLTPKTDPARVADLTTGKLLSTGSVRLDNAGAVEKIPGFDAGDWWVQDFAAALPVKLLGDMSGQRIIDVCAAPGGKTLQMAAAGANVTAIDMSEKRIQRLRENLARTKLSAELVVANALEWQPDFTPDAVLIDAPCNATGTIRRHPDILRTRTPSSATSLVELQKDLLQHAAGLVGSGGKIIYCTCSLDRREGEDQIAQFLNQNHGFELNPVNPGAAGLGPEMVDGNGMMRTLPSMHPIDAASGKPVSGGMDGFFAARLIKK